MNEFVRIVYRNVANSDKTNFEYADLESMFREPIGLTSLRVGHKAAF
jgi:hypothetical protein